MAEVLQVPTPRKVGASSSHPGTIQTSLGLRSVPDRDLIYVRHAYEAILLPAIIGSLFVVAHTE